MSNVQSELPYAYGNPPRDHRQAYIGYNDENTTLGRQDGWYVCGGRKTVAYGDAHTLYYGWFGPFVSEDEARDRAAAYYASTTN